MKILIRDASPEVLREIPIHIQIVSGELENVAVRVEQVTTPVEETGSIPASESKPVSSVPFWRRKTAGLMTHLLARIPVRIPQSLSRSVSSVPSETTASSQLGPRTIEIKITLPALPTRIYTFTEIKQKVKSLPRKNLLTIIFCSVAFIIVAAFTIANNTSSPQGTHAGISSAPKLEHSAPTYDTLLPVGKDIRNLGGWTKVSPPGRDPVHAYTDRIGSVSIIVSEQPLPKNFKQNTQQEIEDLARNFSANEKITAGTTPVHIGTSAKGAQSVIFTKENLLILIKSQDPISNDQWATYINSLQ